MMRKNRIVWLLMSILIGMVSCLKDPEIPTGSFTYAFKTNEDEKSPMISVLQEDGLVQNGDVVNDGDEVPFGFAIASNPETREELASLRVIINDGVFEIIDLTGETGYTYRTTVIFDFYPGKEIIGTAIITAIVTDAAGKTSTATIELYINYEEPLTVTNFIWKRAGSQPAEGLDMFGLKWVKNMKDIFVVIEPVEDAKLYEIPADKWAEVKTTAEKVALFSDNHIASEITSYRGVSATVPTQNYDDVIATLYNGNYYLIHITKSIVSTKGTTIVIEGEWK